MIINGRNHNAGNVNVRNSPTDVGVSNVVGVLSSGQSFTGSEFVTDASNRDWVRLTHVGGIPVDGSRFVARWVVQILSIEEDTGEALGVPVKIETLETFSNGKVRKTIWTNPVVEE